WQTLPIVPLAIPIDRAWFGVAAHSERAAQAACPESVRLAPSRRPWPAKPPRPTCIARRSGPACASDSCPRASEKLVVECLRPFSGRLRLTGLTEETHASGKT